MDHAQALPLLWRRFQHWWVTPAGSPFEPGSAESEPRAQAQVQSQVACVFMQGWALRTPEVERGVALIRAIDAGGVPLNPMRVNDIGRKLGLEVSTSAPMDETIERIRQRLLAMHASETALQVEAAGV